MKTFAVLLIVAVGLWFWLRPAPAPVVHPFFSQTLAPIERAVFSNDLNFPTGVAQEMRLRTVIDELRSRPPSDAVLSAQSASAFLLTAINLTKTYADQYRQDRVMPDTRLILGDGSARSAFFAERTKAAWRSRMQLLQNKVEGEMASLQRLEQLENLRSRSIGTSEVAEIVEAVEKIAQSALPAATANPLDRSAYAQRIVTNAPLQYYSYPASSGVVIRSAPAAAAFHSFPVPHFQAFHSQFTPAPAQTSAER